MTKEEIKKILDNTKVYVNGKSKEIQEKLFSFGYRWDNTNSTEVHNTEKPFLFIFKRGGITHANNMTVFTEHQNREIIADEILSLEITEPSYRPFRDNNECWDEMKKHQPVGWLIGKFGESQTIVEAVLYNSIYIFAASFSYEKAMRMYTFADGTPFGVAED